MPKNPMPFKSLQGYGDSDRKKDDPQSPGCTTKKNFLSILAVKIDTSEGQEDLRLNI